MNGVRLLRIAVIAVVLPGVFRVSQGIATARGNEPVEGLVWAIGALGLLFLLRALATEYSRGPEADFQKDLQWGVAGGCLLIILSSLH
jgi:hypothetical protein